MVEKVRSILNDSQLLVYYQTSVQFFKFLLGFLHLMILVMQVMIEKF